MQIQRECLRLQPRDFAGEGIQGDGDGHVVRVIVDRRRVGQIRARRDGQGTRRKLRADFPTQEIFEDPANGFRMLRTARAPRARSIGQRPVLPPGPDGLGTIAHSKSSPTWAATSSTFQLPQIYITVSPRTKYSCDLPVPSKVSAGVLPSSRSAVRITRKSRKPVKIRRVQSIAIVIRAQAHRWTRQAMILVIHRQQRKPPPCSLQLRPGQPASHPNWRPPRRQPGTATPASSKRDRLTKGATTLAASG